jgi:transposase
MFGRDGGVFVRAPLGGGAHPSRSFGSIDHVKRNKTDSADAETICEAAGRPDMRFVPVETLYHQGVLSLHRVRSLFVRQRTAAINTVRGLLTEFGIVAGKGIQRVAERRQRMETGRG